ncbi:MAG: DUF2723 domain-containing protein [Bacteroidales bacterium]
MRSYRKLNNLIGWIVFLIASLVYILTSEPTTSFWDCGEYIATAYKLQVGHPPGAPFFQLAGRFFSLFAFGDVTLVARMVNTMSALSSSFTILFLFWTITLLAKKLLPPVNKANMWAVFAAGAVGALTYTFTDSFWFSAVEGEVYAMSSFFTAVVFWAALRWEAVADEKHANRWLILIAYLMGLSIGVHLLNLLAIPAITFVVYFRKYQKLSFWRFVLVLLIAFLVLSAIMYGVIPETVTLFASTEMLFVNTLGLPFHSGTVFFALLLISLLVVSLVYVRSEHKQLLKAVYILSGVMALLFLLESRSAGSLIFRMAVLTGIFWFFHWSRRKRPLQQTVILALTFILIGYSSFLMLVIRSNANTPINENSPRDAISLLSYLNREQYGDWPILYGNYYNAPIVEEKPGRPVYMRSDEKGRYVVKDKNAHGVAVYDKQYTTLFPRMWNNTDPKYAAGYKKWAGIQSDPNNKHIPSFGENLRYFFSYQLDHMYWRYFLWNFVGRQNGIQGHGGLVNGNWLSGINFIDEMRLGPQDNMPDNLRSKARNTYYFLPLLLGMLGLVHQFSRRYKDGIVVVLLFIMTGIAIVVYLNQHAPQPRERDYAYAASFYAFAIWIGLGVLSLAHLLRKFLKAGIAVAAAFLVAAIAVPANMAWENWDDHDRSGRYTALEMAKSYLNNCAPNAILFTNGDNDTFPLWYAQEVEGIRTDVRVCNMSLLSGDWYIQQMEYKTYGSDPVPFSLEFDQYKNGTRDVVYLIENENLKDFVDLKEIFRILRNNEEKLKITSGGKVYDYFPAKKFLIRVDSATVVDNGTVPPEYSGEITDLKWTIDRVGIQKNQLMILDFLTHNDWERPVYFSSTTGEDAYLGLQDYFAQEGMTYRLMPVKRPGPDPQTGWIDTDVLYENLVEETWVDMTDPGQYMSEDHIRSSMNLRNVYGRLALALVHEKKYDSAVVVCDKITTMIPNETISYDFFVIPVADAYYEAGETEKGDAILETMLEMYSGNIEYYFSFTGNKAEKVDRKRQQNLAIMQEIAKTARRNGRTGLAGRAGSKFEAYYQRYVGKTYD